MLCQFKISLRHALRKEKNRLPLSSSSEAKDLGQAVRFILL